MSPGWQVLVYGLAFVAFIIGAVMAATRRPWWPVSLAIGLAAVALVALWNANAIYE